MSYPVFFYRNEGGADEIVLRFDGPRQGSTVVRSKGSNWPPVGHVFRADRITKISHLTPLEDVWMDALGITHKLEEAT